MAKRSVAPQRFKDGGENFPILYENDRVLVYKNPTNEIFVEDVRSGVTMRISSHPHGGLLFTTDALVEPVRVTNMIGWRIKNR
jgi:hypothetical protein